MAFEVSTRPIGAWIGRRSFAERARMIAEAILVWQERAEQRHQLARLDDRMLRDIGVTRVEVARELAKPFWRA